MPSVSICSVRACSCTTLVTSKIEFLSNQHPEVVDVTLPRKPDFEGTGEIHTSNKADNTKRYPWRGTEVPVSVMGYLGSMERYGFVRLKNLMREIRTGNRGTHTSPAPGQGVKICSSPSCWRTCVPIFVARRKMRRIAGGAELKGLRCGTK